MSRLTDLQDPVAQARVGRAIALAVKASFILDASTETDAEIKRRANICIEHFKIMRNDMRWSIAKICDLMQKSLVEELEMGNPSRLIDKMASRGWVQVEQQTESGVIIPR